MFEAGSDGYLNYRIPSLIKIRGAFGTEVLVAYAEARQEGSDYGDIDVVRKVSFDDGESWVGFTVVCGENFAGTCGNPTAVWDWEASRIVLMVNQNSPDATKENPVGGRSTWVIREQVLEFWGTVILLPSEPEFVHWQQSWDAVGPGNGIKLERGPEAGNLVFPALGRNWISDDGGSKFSADPIEDAAGNPLRIPTANGTPSAAVESTIVERIDGGLLRADRPSVPRKNEDGVWQSTVYRKPMTVGYPSSTPLEWNFGPYSYREDLWDPGHQCEACTRLLPGIWGGIPTPWVRTCNRCPRTAPLRTQSSLARYSADIPRLFFSGPWSTFRRRKLAMRISYDEGDTWGHCRVIDDRPNGYSSMTKTADFRMGVLYEISLPDLQKRGWQPHSLYFNSFSLADLGDTIR